MSAVKCKRGKIDYCRCRQRSEKRVLIGWVAEVLKWGQSPELNVGILKVIYSFFPKNSALLHFLPNDFWGGGREGNNPTFSAPWGGLLQAVIYTCKSIWTTRCSVLATRVQRCVPVDPGVSSYRQIPFHALPPDPAPVEAIFSSFGLVVDPFGPVGAIFSSLGLVVDPFGPVGAIFSSLV